MVVACPPLGRARRETVRLQAAAWFAEGVEPPEVARQAAGLAELGVCVAAALAGRRRGRAGVEGAGRGGVPAERGAAGPAAGRAGGRPGRLGLGEDQRWTLARVTALIGRLFHVRYTLRGTSYLLHRIGFTPQVPVHRAAERDEDDDRRVAGRDLGEGTRLAAATGA